GADGKLIIWSIPKKEREDIICCNANGDITDIVWASLKPNELSLIFSCADGTIHVYNANLEPVALNFKHIHTFNGFAGPIEKMDFDPFQHRLAAVGEGELRVWDLDSDWSFSLHATELSTGYIAKTVHFFDQGRGVLVGFLKSHRM
ncbi:hypothetical protein M422DRAFT_185520, partial [Sphaerobolus stellatus SS14]